MTDQIRPSKTRSIFYWIVTGLLTLGMLSGGVAQVSHQSATIEGLNHLGYPAYFATLLGSWKILGVIALLIPRFVRLKEWAYAGFFFAMTGAVFSHIASGDEVSKMVAPFLFAVFTLLSWYLRPPSRTGSLALN
ncbi:MAG TPA: DoxX family protein [Puia sp.]|nr:DoxX family protein [Puia sp.]